MILKKENFSCLGNFTAPYLLLINLEFLYGTF